jgi:hypothetical protein
MRRKERYLGDQVEGGTVIDADFRSGLEKTVRGVGGITPIQQHEALEGFVHWGIKAKRPDLALEAYRGYLDKGWAWERGITEQVRRMTQRVEDNIRNTRDENENDTVLFDLYSADEFGRLKHTGERLKNEGEEFRNEVFPRIIQGFVDTDQTQKAYNFLLERRAVHNFKGYPREVDFEQAVDAHVAVAEAILNPSQPFDGDRNAAFADLAKFTFDHATFPQFGHVALLPRLARIRDAMVERKLPDPFKPFLDNVNRGLNSNFFTDFHAPAVINGVLVYVDYLKVKGDQQALESFVNDSRWPMGMTEAFKLVEHNSSIPRGLALLIPQLTRGHVYVSASDAFQSDPIGGAIFFRALLGQVPEDDGMEDDLHEDLHTPELPPTSLPELGPAQAE